MTLGDLIIRARDWLQDVAVPPINSDSFLRDVANEAVREACERAHLLFDTTTPAVTQIALSTDISAYPLHPSIQSIQMVKLTNFDIYLDPRSETDLQHIHGMYWWRDKGNPYPYEYYIRDRVINFYPIPQGADVAQLKVYRTPLSTEEMATTADSPIIPATYHEGLVYWMCRQAYLRQDADTFNAGAAAKNEAEFVARFGPRKSAKHERMRLEAPRGRSIYAQRMGG